MSDHDILPHQNIFTRYESPTPEQAAADIRAHEISIEQIKANPDSGTVEVMVAEKCLRRRIATLQLVVDRGAACDAITARDARVQQKIDDMADPSYAAATGREIDRRHAAAHTEAVAWCEQIAPVAETNDPRRLGMMASRITHLGRYHVVAQHTKGDAVEWTTFDGANVMARGATFTEVAADYAIETDG